MGPVRDLLIFMSMTWWLLFVTAESSGCL